jgi:hypothetical protein
MSKKDEKLDVILEAKNIQTMMRKKFEDSLTEQLAPTIKSMVDAKLQEAEDSYDDTEDEDESMQEIFDFGLNEEESEEETEDETSETETEEAPETEMGGEESGDDTPISQLTKADLQAMITDVVSSLLGDEAGTEDSSEMPDMGGDSSEDGLDEDAMLETILQEIGIQTQTAETSNAELQSLKQENAQLKEAIKILKQSLNESLLTATHIKYLNKLTSEVKLPQEQVIKISESFDSMKSVEEITRAYSLLAESYKNKKEKVEPKKINSKTAIKEGIFRNTNPAPKTQSILKESNQMDSFALKIKKNLGK